MRNKSGMQRPAKAKKQIRLSRAMDSRLKDYSLAAAGVGALALAAPAHASISATAPNLTIPQTGVATSIPVTGFPTALAAKNTDFGDSSASVKVMGGIAGVKFWGSGSSSSFPFPADVGVTVPTGLSSFGSTALLVLSSSSEDRNFLGAAKYIGFQIGTGASAHYGWLEFTITQNGNFTYNVTVTNTAIEQCPGQPIVVGATTGGATCSAPPTTPAPNSLWLMSLGIAGLAGLEALRRLRRTA